MRYSVYTLVDNRMKNTNVLHNNKEIIMKELTHEEWMNNPTPRMMWVWDDDETCIGKLKVIHVSSNKDLAYPVIVLADNDKEICRYKHCAEIPKQRRMTNKELSRWLRENPTRELKYDRQCDKAYSNYNYYDSESDKEVDDRIIIRENDSAWREPLIEEE